MQDSLPFPPSSRLVPVILAGGSGTRLWPLSRPEMPKQFLPLMGPLSPYQQTLDRVRDKARFTAPVIVTTAALAETAAAQAASVGITPRLTLIEPEGRNTGPAVLAAAHAVRELDSGARALLVLPSDHLLEDLAVFDAALQEAQILAEDEGLLVTFGIAPTRPETGYGYIARGAPLVEGRAWLIDRFIEKPARSEAERLLATGRVDWNSGMFCFPIDRLIAEAARLDPALATATAVAVSFGTRQGAVVTLDRVSYAGAPALSIDVAVMEKTADAAVLPLAARWSDIGCFDAVWQNSLRDETGNALVGNVATAASRNCYVRSEGPLTAVIGLDNVVVVASDDAVLVADRSQAQAIKGLAGHIRDRAANQASPDGTEARPWGSYRVLARGNGFQVKQITVLPGGRLSLQYHRHRSEHWTVVAGRPRVTIGDEVRTMAADETAYVPLGAVHRLENPGDEPVHLIEVQHGAYLGEDDIVRLDDIYGRAKATPRTEAA